MIIGCNNRIEVGVSQFIGKQGGNQESRRSERGAKFYCGLCGTTDLGWERGNMGIHLNDDTASPIVAISGKGGQYGVKLNC